MDGSRGRGLPRGRAEGHEEHKATCLLGHVSMKFSSGFEVAFTNMIQVIPGLPESLCEKRDRPGEDSKSF